MGDALIHVRVPAELKARWVRESRAAGMRLTDWIIQKIDMQARVFDVTLYWHAGGRVFLGTVAAVTAKAAEDAALNKYIAGSKDAEKEVEEGGGFDLDAELLDPDEAARA